MCGAKYCDEECSVLRKHMEACPWAQTAAPVGAQATQPTAKATQAVVGAQGAGDWGQPAAAASGQQQQAASNSSHKARSSAQSLAALCSAFTSTTPLLGRWCKSSTSGGSPVAIQWQSCFRLVVSDGHHYQQAVVVTELHARIESGGVETLGLIKLTEVSCRMVAGRRVIIILGLEVVSCRVAKLGAPSNVDPACAAKSASEASQQGAKPAPAAPPKPTPAVAHAEFNVGTNQQPQSAQQPQSLDSDEEEVLRLEEEKAKEVELQIQREAQLMDQWCSWAFCNNAGCASKQC